MTQGNTIAVLGGTFDPVHHGHIQTAFHAFGQVSLERIKIMPLGVAVHRPQPRATAQQRLDMCALAIRDYPMMEVDDREIRRGDGSYTFQTLEQMRSEYGPEQSICWMIGRDSLETFTTWDEWPRILNAGHLLVLNRPGYSNEAPVDAALQSYVKPDFDGASGSIVLCHVPPVDVSSTELRACLSKSHNRTWLETQFIQDALDENVRQYLHDQAIYDAL